MRIMRFVAAVAAAFTFVASPVLAGPDIGARFDFNSSKSTDRPFAYIGPSDGQAHVYQEIGGKRGQFIFDANGNWDVVRYPGKADKVVDGPRFIRLDGSEKYDVDYRWDGKRRIASCDRTVTNGSGRVTCYDRRVGESTADEHVFMIQGGVNVRYEKNGKRVWSLLPTGESVDVATLGE